MVRGLREEKEQDSTPVRFPAKTDGVALPASALLHHYSTTPLLYYTTTRRHDYRTALLHDYTATLLHYYSGLPGRLEAGAAYPGPKDSDLTHSLLHHYSTTRLHDYRLEACAASGYPLGH